MICFIPPTRFELVSPAPKAGMIDRYTTGVFIKLIFIGHFSIEKNAISFMLFRTIRIAFATVLLSGEIKKK